MKAFADQLNQTGGGHHPCSGAGEDPGKTSGYFVDEKERQDAKDYRDIGEHGRTEGN